MHGFEFKTFSDDVFNPKWTGGFELDGSGSHSERIEKGASDCVLGRRGDP